MQHQVVREQIDEVLCPTAATLAVAPADLQATLYQLDVIPNMPAPPNSPDSDTGGDAAAFWLAGQLYRLIARHVALPLALSDRSLDRLISNLSEADRAQLHTLRSRLADQFERLLDGQTYALPPGNVDGEQWREPIRQACDRKQWLTLHYFSAGRNLETVRRVQPYWLEEGPYAGYPARLLRVEQPCSTLPPGQNSGAGAPRHRATMM